MWVRDDLSGFSFASTKHQICFSQCLTHFWAFSLKTARSSAVQTCSNRGHWRRRCMVCGGVLQSQVTSLSKSWYPHFWRFTLERPTPVFRRLRHFHSVHLVSAPGGSSSWGFRSTGVAFVRFEILSAHILILVSPGDVTRGSTLLRKLFLDFRRLAAGVWLNTGWRSSSTWRLRSFMLATWRLMSGEAIPACQYV